MSVTVYRVQIYNVATDELILSRRMATVAGAHRMGGDIVDSTNVEIDESQLETGMQWTKRDFNPRAESGFQRQVRS